MSDPKPPSAPSDPRATSPWWRTVLAQYLVPTAFASIIASGLSVLTALNTAQEQRREYNEKFESLVGNTRIINAFGGVYVADPLRGVYRNLDAYILARTKASYTQAVREQQAAATLVALQSVAESEAQRRTVLLIGARLLNADQTSASTGGEAARLLTVLIDEADRGRQSWNPFERSLNSSLWDTMSSPAFMDLVTAEYENNYYNDPLTNGDLRPYWPTLNGDAPVSHDAKFKVLWELTAPQYEGWIHVATFGYNFPRRVSPSKKAPSLTRAARTQAVHPEASSLAQELVDVMLRHHIANVGMATTQYAIPNPRETPFRSPLFVANRLVDQDQFPATWIMLRHRLLRSRPPVEYISPDGAFRKGSMGRIVGVVPAGSCITVVEPLLPILVFLPSYVVANRPAPGAGSRVPEEFTGLVHMWAHVRATKDNEDCLTTVVKVN